MRRGPAARLAWRPGDPGRALARRTEAGARRRSRVAADSPAVARRASTAARDQVRAHGRLYDRLFRAALTAVAPLRRRARFRGLILFVRDHARSGGVDREALREAGPAQLPQRRGGGPSAPLAALDEADLSPGRPGGRAVALPRRSLRSVGIEAEAVSNTAPLERFTFRERRPLRPTLLSNRSLESHYNVADTLRAFALIERRMPDARLIVAGDGSDRARLRALA